MAEMTPQKEFRVNLRMIGRVFPPIQPFLIPISATSWIMEHGGEVCRITENVVGKLTPNKEKDYSAVVKRIKRERAEQAKKGSKVTPGKAKKRD